MDRWLLGGYTDEALIPTALVRKWTAVIQSVLHEATEWEHKHGGPCDGNPSCGFSRMGVDCPEPCPMPVCGNRRHKDGVKRIRVLRKPDQRRVFTREPIEKGRQIGEFTGIVMQTADYRKFARELREDKGAFLSGVDYINGEHLVLVARKVGNWSQLIRHSCEPNLIQVCRMGASRVPVLRLQASRNIAAGEPLTLDFGKEMCNEGMDFGSEAEAEGEDPEMEMDEEEEVADKTDDEEGEVNEQHVDEIEEESKVEAAGGVGHSDESGVENSGLDQANKDEAVATACESALPMVENGPDAEAFESRELEDGEISDDEEDGQVEELEEGECRESDSEDDAMEVQVASTDDVGGDISTTKSSETGVTVLPAQEAIIDRSTQELPGDEIEAGGPAHNEVTPTTSELNVRMRGSGEQQGRQLEKERKLAISLRDIREGSRELRRFVCGDCSKTFVCPSKLKRHALSHERGSFPCNVCGVFSSTKGGLQRHMYRHRDPESGVKKVVVCKRKTPMAGKRFTCDHCGRSYSRKSDLTRHMARHAVEKNFDCSECEKKFLQSVELVQHVSAIHMQ